MQWAGSCTALPASCMGLRDGAAQEGLRLPSVLCDWSSDSVLLWLSLSAFHCCAPA